jgi:hypothetical protein
MHKFGIVTVIAQIESAGADPMHGLFTMSGIEITGNLIYLSFGANFVCHTKPLGGDYPVVISWGKATIRDET